MKSVKSKCIFTGGNRHPAAADWDPQGSGILAFGAGNNIAIWSPLGGHQGIRVILSGHTATVNAVRFFPVARSRVQFLLSGSADNTIRIWRTDSTTANGYRCLTTVSDHSSSINCISVLSNSQIFVSGSADGSVKVWKLAQDGDCVEPLQSIQLNPRFFPLTLSLARLDCGSSVLAVAGTRPIVQVFLLNDDHFQLVATLTGHEGWIRSLSFTRETEDSESDLILASASQDKYIRLWRLHRGEELPATSATANDPSLGTIGKSLSNKAHRFQADGLTHSITFEALLLGHEDWVYSTSWRPSKSGLQLLSASADNSLAIWEPEAISGIWVCIARLGEINAQKGATTATGSIGGFWVGLWSSDGNSIASVGRTGSWRLWNSDGTERLWKQTIAVTGHVKEVKDLTWSSRGSYLLSTGSDQTTRLYAEWRGQGETSWHEFSRPQIHGYDLNCIDSITDSQFVSGADEKLLRVFDEPNAIATLLDRVCRIQGPSSKLPDAASIPVLGLSNKAIPIVQDETLEIVSDEDPPQASDSATVAQRSTLDLDHPPFEDHLSRHTLWPEKEKLYGHGYEISTVAATHDGRFLATACRASSIDHAVIRLYDTGDWREIKPPLTSHSLTVTRLEFSDDDRYLLSIGRDRQWTVFERNADVPSEYKLVKSNPKGHSRMILGCSWLPSSIERAFATSARDKSVKLWRLDGTCVSSHADPAPVTSVAVAPHSAIGRVILAYGTDSGGISVCVLDKDLQFYSCVAIPQDLAPSGAINRLAWRPTYHYTANGQRQSETQRDSTTQLAVASDDTTVRLYDLVIS